MEPNQNPEHAPFWMWMVLLAVILIGVGFFAWINSSQSKTETAVPVAETSTPATAVVTPATTPTTVSTADWKTYTNTTYSYSIKYPSDWYLYDSNNKDVRVQPKQAYSGPVANEPIPGPDSNAFEVIVSSTTKSLTDAANVASNGMGKTRTSIIIGGQPGILGTTTCADNPGVGCDAPTWLVVYKGYQYLISSNLGYDSNKTDFEAILSTFQFTK